MMAHRAHARRGQTASRPGVVPPPRVARAARGALRPHPIVARSQSLPGPASGPDAEDATSTSSGTREQVVFTREAATGGVSAGSFKLGRAASAARRYFDALNAKDYGAAEVLFSPEGCLLEDLNEPVCFAGRDQVRDYISKTFAGLSEDFFLQEISDGDDACGVTWVNGSKRGATFVRVDRSGRIVYARDLAEPESKPGDAAFSIMKVVLPVLKNLDSTKVTEGWPENDFAGGAGAGGGEAARVVRSFYDHINRKEVDEAMTYFAEDCLYEDLNFPEPYVGKDAVRTLMQKSCDSIPEDLVFCIDDISEGASGVGLTWHLELDGKRFPFSRGCSFYKVKDGQVVYARDLVEPSSKKGKALREEVSFSAASLALFAAAALYTSLLILSPPGFAGVPGEGIFWIKPETLEEVQGLSLYDFFFVLPALKSVGVGVPGMPETLPAYHPVNEALFNFVNAWSLMFYPLLLRDTKSVSLPKTAWWSVQMFLRNAILMPFLALRASNEPTIARVEAARSEGNHGLLSKSFGVVGAVVGVASVFWFALARPELGGDLARRVDYFANYISTDRVAFAFCVDLALYSVWQPYLISEVEKQEGLRPDPLKFVPFFGLAKWLQTSSGLKLFDKDQGT